MTDFWLEINRPFLNFGTPVAARKKVPNPGLRLRLWFQEAIMADDKRRADAYLKAMDEVDEINRTRKAGSFTYLVRRR
jgi:hypothetical protein